MGCMQCYCSNLKVACKSSSLVYSRVETDFRKENWFVSDLKNELEDYVDLVDENEIKYEINNMLFINKPIYFINSFRNDFKVKFFSFSFLFLFFVWRYIFK